MIQKFQKYFRLKQYDYFFAKSAEALRILRRTHSILYSTGGDFCNDTDAFIKRYVDSCYYKDYIQINQCRDISYMFFGVILLHNTEPVCYYDRCNSTFVVLNTISSEIKDLLYKYIYYSKSKEITYFQKVVEVDRLEYEEVYVKQSVDSFDRIKKLFYSNFYDSELLNTNDEYFICDIPINNKDFLSKVFTGRLSNVQKSINSGNDTYINFFGTVYNDLTNIDYINDEENNAEDEDLFEEESEEELVEEEESPAW